VDNCDHKSGKLCVLGQSGKARQRDMSEAESGKQESRYRLFTAHYHAVSSCLSATVNHVFVFFLRSSM